MATNYAQAQTLIGLTRLKTVEYWFPPIATLADASDTAATQITVYIPEAASGTIEFRSVVTDVIVHDANTTLTNVTQRQTVLTLQGASASTVNNTQTLAQGGENFCHMFSADFTTYFNSNWGSNASRTLDCSLTINTGATGSRNASIRVVITYTFDDTQSTHVKTVWIPLDAPTGAMGTTKSTVYDTIPALDTYCPEASKTFRQTTIVVQGNTEGNGAVDKSISIEVDSLGASTSELYELGSTTDVWYRYNSVVSFDTSTTHSLYLWASTADFDHPHVWLVVTYEFSPSTTTTILNSLLLPMEFGGPMGGPTSSDFQRGERELWIEEPATITLQRLAILFFYDKLAAQTGVNARIGTGSFVSYTDVATVVAGGAGLMVRNDSAFSLSRGRNTISADIYNTDANDLGFNLASLWMVNYTSGVPSGGVWAANHTIIRNLRAINTSAGSVQSIVSAVAPDLPETNTFRTSIGLHYVYTSNGQGNAAGVHIGAERLVGEGGLIWENVYESIGGTDPEVGVRQAFATARNVFRRWTAGTVVDADTDRLSLEQARRWRIALGGACVSHDHLDMYITYHTITFTIAGTVSGSAGGTVTLSLHRESNGEKVMQKTQTGNGAFSFTWFDDTEQMYVDAYEDGTHVGRSAIDVAV